ncbi:MAG: hydroxylamine reductase [Bacillota bacterium]|nr:hydroxylamine reductase [Bacillota bacterium]
MFCFQCQETAKNEGCTIKGVCGKSPKVAKLQDLLIYLLKGISISSLKADEKGIDQAKVNKFIVEGLFSTITNVNFNSDYFMKKIKEALALRDEIIEEIGDDRNEMHDAQVWSPQNDDEIKEKAGKVGVLATENEDIRSLRELITYGLKGLAAYTDHAFILGYSDDNIFSFIKKALVATLDDSLSANDLISLTLETGQYGVNVMALLDKANTSTYGDPEITKVNIGVKDNPGILISGHDLKDLEELLEQTKRTGVDVYTHGEMLPAHYYPFFKKYDHFAGNYGNAWWEQKDEFESFNGPVLLTTNCLVPPRDSYKDRVYTTGTVGFSGLTHIPDRETGKAKDFSAIIEHAKKCDAPQEIETGEIVGGFAHGTVLGLADKVVEAVKSGAIRKFMVMAGCDGRAKMREYYTEFAKKLPDDVVILTAGCAKYRYNKFDLGDIGGIPRVLDAGQCNDSYSLAVIALKLKEVFEMNDINELPISYDIAWYEQKAVIVLLALLYLGVKNIHLGPTLPAFLSPNVTDVLVEKFGLSGISTVDEDIKELG